MSADRWGACPRCVRALRIEVGVEAAAVEAAYGRVGIEEFDRLREQAAARRARLDAMTNPGLEPYAEDLTLREDFEASTNVEGRVYVNYEAGCSRCGFTIREHVDRMVDLTTEED